MEIGPYVIKSGVLRGGVCEAREAHTFTSTSILLMGPLKQFDLQRIFLGKKGMAWSMSNQFVDKIW
jgi:dolichol kinase